MRSTFIILAGIFVFGCNTNQKSADSISDRDLIEKNVRHGWTVFTGPKRTIVGVNDSESIERGQKLFVKHCQLCHGPNGEGDGQHSKELGIKPTNLTTIARILPNHFLVMQINEGRGDMPKWNDILEHQEAWDLTNYIQTLKKH
ncbi:MAG: hypothetical protein A2Z20_03620 [Bdellovibrionales bacterium RBG_16_40_8]|nr:MAG: hypothetical protein A2Z20_03620 [Bdellovibrionales bacterium RBG_16_40_8]